VTSIVVVEGPLEAFEDAVADVASGGHQIVQGWDPAPNAELSRCVCVGAVTNEGDAERAIRAALRGAGLVVHAQASREVIDRFCEDARHLGPLDHRFGMPERPPALDGEETTLLELLSDGHSLVEAAARLNISKRTADRRLASARGKLGAATRAEAVVAFRRRGTPDR
jgi:DNA-binding NarL/FixJ family response regulator